MFYDVNINWWENYVSWVNNIKKSNLKIGILIPELVTFRQKVEASIVQWIQMEVQRKFCKTDVGDVTQIFTKSKVTFSYSLCCHTYTHGKGKQEALSISGTVMP